MPVISLIMMSGPGRSLRLSGVTLGHSGFASRGFFKFRLLLVFAFVGRPGVFNLKFAFVTLIPPAGFSAMASLRFRVKFRHSLSHTGDTALAS